MFLNSLSRYLKQLSELYEQYQTSFIPFKAKFGMNPEIRQDVATGYQDAAALKSFLRPHSGVHFLSQCDPRTNLWELRDIDNNVCVFLFVLSIRSP